jgi:hypothetical protein
MTRFFVAGWLPALVVVGGCGSAPVEATVDPSSNAGTSSNAGSGDDTGQRPLGDGGGGSSTSPGAPSPAGPSSVRITVVSEVRKPRAGVKVVFQNAKGDVVLDTVSDEAGRAAAVLPAEGGTVTVAGGNAAVDSFGVSRTKRRLTTFLAVKNGDDLLAVDVTYTPLVESSGTVSVGSAPQPMPPLPPGLPAGAQARYSATLGNCRQRSSAFPVAIPLDRYCGPPGAFPVLMFAGNQVDSDWTHFAFSAPIATQGALSIQTVDKSNFSAWTQPGEVTIAAANVPTSAVYRRLGYANVDGPSLVWASELARGTSVSATSRTMPGFAKQGQPNLVLHSAVPGQAGASYAGVQILAKAIPPPAAGAQITLDANQNLPPIIESKVEGFAQPTVSWKTTGPMVSADGAFLRLNWSNNGGAVDWMVLFPPSVASSIDLRLPPSLADWAPSPATSLDPQGQPAPPTLWELAFVESDALADYGAFKASYVRFLPANSLGEVFGAGSWVLHHFYPLPMGATVRASSRLVNAVPGTMPVLGW